MGDTKRLDRVERSLEAMTPEERERVRQAVRRRISREDVERGLRELVASHDPEVWWRALELLQQMKAGGA